MWEFFGGGLSIDGARVILWTKCQISGGATPQGRDPRVGEEDSGVWNLRKSYETVEMPLGSCICKSRSWKRGQGWRCLLGNIDVYIGQQTPSHDLKFSATIFLLYFPPFPSASQSILGNHLPQTRKLLLSVLPLEAMSQGRTIEKRQVQCF